MKALPAIQGRMGDTTYYETKVSGRELASTVRPARETDSWATASVEERMQRDLDMRRVRAELVPYLAKHPERFWGSIIVLVEKGSLVFERLTDYVGDIPHAYDAAVESMGFLTVSTGEHIALDGQHRLKAVQEVINSGVELGPFQSKVGDDEMSVLVIEFQNAERTRRIFSKVNQHAKPTGRADNIILSEDDGYAIVTRRLLRPGIDAPLAQREDAEGNKVELVNWKSNTLSKRMTHLTTISVVYDTVEQVLNASGYTGWAERELQVRPPDDQLDAAYDIVEPWWERILTHIDVLRDALADRTLVPTVRFAHDDKRTLLLRPVGQIALVRGVVLAMTRSSDTGHLTDAALSLETALDRANQLDWSATSTSYWRDTIIRADGRMVARNEAYQVASELVAYLIAKEYTTSEQRDALWTMWNKVRGKELDKTTREAITDPEERRERTPEPLPDPMS